MTKTPGIDFKSKAESVARSIEKPRELTEKDKELLLNFKRDMKLQNISDSYLHKLI